MKLFASVAAASTVLALLGVAGSDNTGRKQLNAQTFEVVWSTVRDTHWDPAMNGADWNAVRAEFLPKAESATDDAQLRSVLMDALQKLGQSHFAIIPADLASEDLPDNRDAQGVATDADHETPAPKVKQASREAQPGLSGAELSFLPRADRPGEFDAIVTAVTAGSEAEGAGLTPGMRVTAIGGSAISQKLPQGDGLERHERASIAHAFSTGLPGSESLWSVETIQGESREISMKFVEDPRPLVKFGSLPALPTELSWRHLDETERARFGAGNHEIGLIRFNIWLIPVAKPFDLAVDTLRSSDGIIIDLRGNPGGIGGMAMGIAGHFTQQQENLGDMRTRETTMSFITNPRKVNRAGEVVTPYAGPVAILVDEGTASTSEIFAGGLQYLKRARIFGTRTAGAALPAVTTPLPNGDVFLHAIADWRLPNGTALEASGVKPNNDHLYTRLDFARDGDPALADAVRWIASNPRAQAVDHPAPSTK